MTTTWVLVWLAMGQQPIVLTGIATQLECKQIVEDVLKQVPKKRKGPIGMGGAFLIWELIQLPRSRKLPSRQPGYDGRREMVADLVESPFTPGTYDPVVRNIRESSLTAMHNRGHLDDAQFEAGSWFRKTFEQARAGSMAVDPSREPVDTSGQVDPIPDALIAASKLLRVARYELGREGYRIVEMVCGMGFGIRESAKEWDEKYEGTGWRLRNALDDLAVWRGFASRKEK